MSTSPYDDTSGSSTREPRTLMDRLMTFSLASEIATLRDEPQYSDGDRNSRTLAKHVDLRVLLSVLRSGATLDEHHGDARMTIHVLDGSLVLQVDGQTTEAVAGTVAVVDKGRPWILTANSDAAVLVTIAWPPDQAGV